MPHKHHSLPSEMWVRVNTARVAAYNSFIEEKDEDNIYFETIILYFLALTQYPLNFAVLDSSYQVIFHFSRDKQHMRSFTYDVESRCKRLEYNDGNTFQLFPHLLGDSYRIAIYFMSTKSVDTPWHLVENDPKSQNFADDGDLSFVRSKYGFISLCANLFFVDDWYAFDTEFAPLARTAISRSIGKLQERYFEVTSKLETHPDIPEWPNSSGSESWRETVNSSLQPFVRDSFFGFRCITSISHELSKVNQSKTRKNIHVPPNILIAYRSYSRWHDMDASSQSGNDIYRHSIDERGGYLYDVQFVTPMAKSHQGPTNLADFRIESGRYQDFFRDLAKLKVPNSYHDESRNFFLYGNILDDLNFDAVSEERREWLIRGKSLVKVIDSEFWKLIKSGNEGISKIMQHLASPIGLHARSMADPVFNTGLIHFNKIFELGGLDRVDLSSVKKCKSYNDISKELQDDLMRIAAVYYIISSAAGGFDNGKKVHPRDLVAMLVPIKIRGAVWGVAIHGYYENEQNDIPPHLDETGWLSRFLFATAGRAKSQGRIDSILWGRAQARVAELLSRHLGDLGKQNRGASREMIGRRFEEAIDKVNEKLRGEQLASPYAFPEFTVQPANHIVPVGSFVDQYVGRDRQGERRYLRFCWTIRENPFFVPLQRWTRVGTRSFDDAVRLGLTSGFELMRAGYDS